MGLKEAFNLQGTSWKELLKRAAKEVSADHCPAYAAAMAYYFLFAIFPFFIFLTAIIAFLPIPNLFDIIIASLQNVLPGQALDMLKDNIQKVVSTQKGGLLSFGIIAALWTSSSAIVAIMDGLNRAYDVEESRSFLKVRLIAIAMVVGMSIFIIGGTILLMFGPKIGAMVAGKLGLGSLFRITWNILQWPVAVVLMMLAISAIYYFGPDVKQSWKWVSPGSVLAIIIWILVSIGFSVYVNRFGSYDKTYGSLGAVIVLLTWMFVSGLAILVGGEVNAEIEHASPEGKDPGEKR